MNAKDIYPLLKLKSVGLTEKYADKPLEKLFRFVVPVRDSYECLYLRRHGALGGKLNGEIGLHPKFSGLARAFRNIKGVKLRSSSEHELLKESSNMRDFPRVGGLSKNFWYLPIIVDDEEALFSLLRIIRQEDLPYKKQASQTNDDQPTHHIDEIDCQGTGYEPDAKKRKAIEHYAVKRARNVYENDGYKVIEKGKPYDLHCTKGDEVLHVEVKGSSECSHSYQE